MSGERKPSQARDRTLGAQLRAIRKEQTNYSLEQAAEAVGWSPSTLSRTENGKRHITSEDVAVLLTAYKVPASQREELIEAARATGQSGWWSRPLPGVLPDVGTLAGYESEARALTNWSVGLIPGLLQTHRYAAGFMLADGADPRDVEMRWMARLRQQQVLSKVDYTALIHECALYVPFGGSDALKERLAHLYGAADRGHSVRIVRDRVPHGALLHSWLMLEFPQAPSVLYVELQRSGVFLHGAEVEVYEAVRSQLHRVALSGAESRSMLRGLMERL